MRFSVLFWHMYTSWNDQIRLVNKSITSRTYHCFVAKTSKIYSLTNFEEHNALLLCHSCTILCNRSLTPEPAIPLQPVHAKEMKARQRAVCTCTPCPLQAQGPPAGDRIKKVWRMHTREDYSVSKRGWSLSFATTLTSLDDVTISEINQAQDKYCMISFVGGI